MKKTVVRNFRDLFNLLETLCVVWFTAEYLLKAVVCTDIFHTLFCVPFNLVDAAAIVPFYFEIVATRFGAKNLEVGSVMNRLHG